jgi:hypothetical protein
MFTLFLCKCKFRTLALEQVPAETFAQICRKIKRAKLKVHITTNAQICEKCGLRFDNAKHAKMFNPGDVEEAIKQLSVELALCDEREKIGAELEGLGESYRRLVPFVLGIAKPIVVSSVAIPEINDEMLEMIAAAESLRDALDCMVGATREARAAVSLGLSE